VKVTVRNRNVTLSGSVHWQFQRVATERALHYIRGVRSILNTIQVLPASEPTDLESAIDAALARNAEIERSQVTVRVEGSAATLTGSVLTWAERRQVEDTCWSAPSIATVDNELRVRL
jgi:osmotically-inducible protein OsmY